MNHALNVLVVDDDPMMAKTLADILRFKGYDAEIAHSGKEALTYFKHMPLDCLISDVKMSEMSGVELCRQVKRITPDLPIVLMTAYSEDSLVRQGKQEGAADVLTKPLDIDKLLEFLDNLKGDCHG